MAYATLRYHFHVDYGFYFRLIQMSSAKPLQIWGFRDFVKVHLLTVFSILSRQDQGFDNFYQFLRAIQGFSSSKFLKVFYLTFDYFYT